MFFNPSAQGKIVPGETTQTNQDVHQLGVVTSEGQRFSLQGGLGINMARQPVRLPAGYRLIRIITGKAYVTYNREDLVLHSGSELSLDYGSEDAVVSCMGSNTLIFDVLR